MRFIKVYGRVLSLLRPEWRTAGLLALANLAIAGIAFIDPVIFGRVVEMLTASATLPEAELWGRAASLLGLWAALGLGGIAAGMAVALLADRMAHRARKREMARFFGHALALPAAFHGGTHSGKLMRIFLTGGDTLFGLWLGFFRDQLVTFVSAIILLPLTLFLNWRLALALIALVVLFVGLTAAVIAKTEARQKRAEKFHNKLAADAQDALSNAVVVQAFTRLGAERRAFADVQQQVIDHQFPVLGWWALVSILTRSASTVAMLSIVVIGTLLHIRGQAGVGDIVSFMGFAGMLIGRLEGMVFFVARLFSTVPTLDEYFAVLDAESTVPEASDARPLQAGPGEVRFEGVGFAYPRGPAILSGVDFTARPGSVVALVGHTGAGKSTAMSLLQRIWDPSEGRITIDGQDTRDVTLESLRGAIGVVFQDSLLFNRSIRDNLLVGKPDATQEEIERACRLAEAHDFILRQSDGYDTLVGERGATLSGGQKQRLAIARALLKNPPILVLDEATSALDAATEGKVTRALRALMQGRTTFVIAHRLSTVRDADEILVFEEGRVAERGSFDGLVAEGGRFAELVSNQLAPAPVQSNVVPFEARVAA
ncbi:glucan ABC transporter ATP-binding protein/ permease [Roseomonas hellenica]|uniref:Glucan ABC transporter ATP-binding protein/ permease n=1 Tax=Plastoroseomonas hellenica TaxID=2687306 RepID=A0ABS5F9R4_9PROT|nr:glucan ABC transporter ATP-binding protein/ permease [Plastoroseomonas hellenica]MBR0669236.1 glucan ABC transporter ATP-binding protein/ permease [Plastoroseomonas hellenica]